MELGLCMASLLDRDWEPALALTQELGIAKVEAMGGGHTPRRHYDPLALATSAEARRAFTGAAADHGIEEVYTWTQDGNAAMRALNERLGYATTMVGIQLARPLAGLFDRP